LNWSKGPGMLKSLKLSWIELFNKPFCPATEESNEFTASVEPSDEVLTKDSDEELSKVDCEAEEVLFESSDEVLSEFCVVSLSNLLIRSFAFKASTPSTGVFGGAGGNGVELPEDVRLVGIIFKHKANSIFSLSIFFFLYN
jgi:hypothetical protein